ncbi:MAG: zinc metallopeptidase [Pseudomonadales bacterium]|jgi:hypothetical protein|nr:zinc metallopeptidase [Pseudomonadales bacterium]MDP7358914.1 zinc metallopeptidase [Pseudomonadales bacterium]MDP7596497.1 zinc metallopeptidase [Pseudomonadales bacterium]HJN53326.1 zinc metallopeptidase [Pseudomonadales bacterium]|tara:strand:+ start:62 stop:754 length:693 start_codon:yes stop_codon:yes gene_type:complete
MSYVILALLALAAVYGPQLWVRFILYRYAGELPEIPGTGGELAQHLINRFELSGVTVEETQPFQDHYSPEEKVVRLSPDNFRRRSLTAIAVAAHEVGHAIQYQRNDPTCQLKKRFLPSALIIKKAGILFMSLPFFSLMLQAPGLGVAAGLFALITMLVSALIYLIILPEEWDASFYKALPILTEGEYIAEHQILAVRQVLRAAALTYFAAALADVVRLWRWGGILRGLRL